MAELLLAVYVFPSIQVYDSQATCVSVPETELLMVKSSVTIESSIDTPLGMVNVGSYYLHYKYYHQSMYMIHKPLVYRSRNKLLMVKSSVTVESHPLILPLSIVKVAVLLLAVYVFPSIHVYDPQATCVSVPETELLVKSSVTGITSIDTSIKYSEGGRVITSVYVFPSIQVYDPQAGICS